MKKILTISILALIPISIFAFPYGSVMNFNPAYMVYNTQWSVSYESYFNQPNMNLLIFQPFKNGFAGKLGFYTQQSTSGVVYGIATQFNKIAIGTDFLVSAYGTQLSIAIDAGAIQNISKNLDVTVRLPQIATYVYGHGISVSPDFEIGVDLPYENWSAGGTLEIGQTIKGSMWGSLAFFGVQALARIDSWYNTSILSSSENTFTFIGQYTLGSMNLAYIYQNIWGNISKSQTNGVRISLEW